MSFHIQHSGLKLFVFFLYTQSIAYGSAVLTLLNIYFFSFVGFLKTNDAIGRRKK